MILHGPPGCGKTFVLRAVMEYAKRANLLTRVVQCAYTAKAAYELSQADCPAWTTCKFFGISFARTLSDCRRQELWARLKRLQLLIIDEMSFISLEHLHLIFLRCQTLNSSLPFGGLHVLLCGDLFQHRPWESSTRSLMSLGVARVQVVTWGKS